MFRFSLKLILLFVVIFGFLSLSTPFFIKKDINSFKGKESRNIDNVQLAFFGSSHSLCTYDPRVFENELGFNTYNYGIGAQRLITSSVVIKENLNKNIKLGVVDIFAGTIQGLPFKESVKISQYNSFDNTPNSFFKLLTYNNIYGLKNILNVFPIIRDHVLWKERLLQPNYILKEEIDYYKGFRAELSFKETRWKRSAKGKTENNKPKLQGKLELSEEQKLYIDQVIDMFKQQNIPLLFVSAPVHKNYIPNRLYTYQHLIANYLKAKDVAFIDYNHLWDELNLETYDFRDTGHLNSSGALKVSSHLSNYIKDNYSISGGLVKKSEYNRYFLMDNNYKGAKLKSKIKIKALNKATGIEEIVFFKDRYNRLEILFVGKKLNQVKVKLSYKISDKSEIRNLSDDLKSKIKDGNLTISTTLGRPSTYGNKEFKVLLIDCPFSKLEDIDMSVGNRKMHRVISNKTIEFKDKIFEY